MARAEAAAVARAGLPLPGDALGLVLALAAAASLGALPFVTVKANRIVPGDPRPLIDLLGVGAGPLAALLVAGLVLASLAGRRPLLRLGAAVLGLVAAAATLAHCADALTPAANRVLRVAPGGAFWISALACALLATDALTRLRPGPGVRIAALLAAAALLVPAFAGGFFDNISVMREYAVNADRFAAEVRRHLALSGGSLGAALIAGLPLGIACHGRPVVREAVLATLNVVQTIPSIALFGILMVPLGALAAASPLAASIGIRGIGPAPAAIALFLYAMLPVVANTVAGLQRVPAAASDAARGVGMTGAQRLLGVELPLALPVILSGIRVALVQNIGMVTIAALIGGGGLGSFVFQGIGQTATDLVLLGSIPIVTFAFVAAVLLGALIEILERRPS